jgi:hypothetical protein
MRLKWRRFVAAAPGTRFMALHEREHAGRRGVAQRIALWCTGGVLVLAGFVMLFTPGPGLLAMAFGIACIAHESRAFARKCDRTEVRLRERYARWKARRR